MDCSAPRCDDTAINLIFIPSCIVPAMDCSAPRCDNTATNLICIPSCIVQWHLIPFDVRYGLLCSSPQRRQHQSDLHPILYSTDTFFLYYYSHITLDFLTLVLGMTRVAAWVGIDAAPSLSDMHMSSPSNHGSYDIEIPAVVLDSLLPEMVQRLCLSPQSTSMESVGEDTRSLPQEARTSCLN